MNPTSMVPVLERDGKFLSESMPICEYIDEVFPDSGYPLLSRTCPFERYEVRRLCEIINSGTQPLMSKRTCARIVAAGGKEDPWAKESISTGLGHFEKVLERTSKDRRFCFGNTVSLADAFLIPMLYKGAYYGVHSEDFPVIHSVAQNLKAMPEFFYAEPENQLDAPVSESEEDF